MTTNDLIAYALGYHENGFKVVITDKQKRPVSAWAKFRNSQSEAEIEEMCRNVKAYGIAVICEGGIEVIDVDSKYDVTGELFSKLIGQLKEALGFEWDNAPFTVFKTVSGGYHIIYRTNLIEGNQKLAQRATVEGEEGATRVLIETRGEGGYFVVPPTQGYEVVDLSDETNIAPTITDRQRRIIIAICKSFDELGTHNKSPQAKATIPVEVIGEDKSTIEAFNESHTAYELLIADGWQYAYTRGDNDYLVRQGKTVKQGIGACYSRSHQTAYIFTTSTQFDADRAYNAFQVYTHLNHNGDYKAAAKQLYRDGYGVRLSRKTDSHSAKVSAITSGDAADVVSDDVLDKIFSNKFSITKTPAKRFYNLFHVDGLGNKTAMASFGDIVTIVGAAKSRKSSFGSSIIASGVGNGSEVLNMELDLQDRAIVYLDTEQSEDEFYEVQKRIYKQANQVFDPAKYFAFNIAEYENTTMLAFVEYAIKRVGDVGVVFLDGIVDLCEDYNDQIISRKLVQHIRAIATKYNCMIITVLHNARSTGDARGHLGTELINKSRTVIQVTKDAESSVSTVQFKYTRGQCPDSYDFSHDANGNLVTV